MRLSIRWRRHHLQKSSNGWIMRERLWEMIVVCRQSSPTENEQCSSTIRCSTRTLRRLWHRASTTSTVRSHPRDSSSPCANCTRTVSGWKNPHRVTKLHGNRLRTWTGATASVGRHEVRETLLRIPRKVPCLKGEVVRFDSSEAEVGHSGARRRRRNLLIRIRTPAAGQLQSQGFPRVTVSRVRIPDSRTLRSNQLLLCSREPDSLRDPNLRMRTTPTSLKYRISSPPLSYLKWPTPFWPTKLKFR